MNTRREFLAASGAFAALSALPEGVAADQPRMLSIYLHGMVWNRQLPAPMNDWLLRLDAKADISLGGAPPTAVPGFATLGDDFHDNLGSHVTIRTAALQGEELTLTGIVAESKDGTLIGQSIRISGRVRGSAVEGLTVTIGADTFTGAGLLVVIAIIAILIG
jgi:hypothetical protein